MNSLKTQQVLKSSGDFCLQKYLKGNKPFERKSKDINPFVRTLYYCCCASGVAIVGQKTSDPKADFTQENI